MMKRVIALILTLCTFAVTGASASRQSELNAYPWARESVEYCINNGIISGTDNGELQLGGYLTRGQMAKIFTEAFNLIPSSMSYFYDVSTNEWFYRYSMSIQSVMPKRSAAFNGGEYVTREEFAATLVRASGKSASDGYAVTTYSFRDAAAVDDAYKNLLETAVVNLYMLGDGGNIRPKDLLTRAEACVFLYRALNPDAGKTYITGGAEVSMEQAVAWARANGADDRFIDVAPLYWYYGGIFGIRPEVMYAQAAKETAYGRYGGAVLPEMNNWAGIKIRNPEGDRTEDHETFLTPEDGVRAHYNHMSAYVGVDPVGEVHERYYVVKTIEWAGTVKYVEQLGGRWCPDINYGYDVLRAVENMKRY